MLLLMSVIIFGYNGQFFVVLYYAGCLGCCWVGCYDAIMLVVMAVIWTVVWLVVKAVVMVIAIAAVSSPSSSSILGDV